MPAPLQLRCWVKCFFSYCPMHTPFCLLQGPVKNHQPDWSHSGGKVMLILNIVLQECLKAPLRLEKCCALGCSATQPEAQSMQWRVFSANKQEKQKVEEGEEYYHYGTGGELRPKKEIKWLIPGHTGNRWQLWIERWILPDAVPEACLSYEM